MNTLYELNNYNLNLSITYRDERSAGIAFSSILANDQKAVIKQSKDHIVPLGIDITDIIEGDLLNIRFEIDVSPIMPYASVDWGTLPEGVYATTIGTNAIYTLNGITTKAQWDQIKDAKIVSSTADIGDYEYSASIFYNPSAAKQWLVQLIVQQSFDLFSHFNIDMIGKVQFGSRATLTSSNYIDMIGRNANIRASSNLNSTFSQTAIGKLAYIGKAVAPLTTTAIMTTNGRLANQKINAQLATSISTITRGGYLLDASSGLNSVYNTSFGNNTSITVSDFSFEYSGSVGSFRVSGTNLTIYKSNGTTVYYANANNQSVTVAGLNGSIGITGSLTSFVNLSVAITKISKWNMPLTRIRIGATSATIYITSVPTTLPATVTDLSYCFKNCVQFNQDISTWNTSNVTNMSHMFDNDGGNTPMEFNQPLNNWNTSNVTDMSYMFYFASNFNQPLNNWDTSNVTDMSYMFHGCTDFNQNINAWDTSNVTLMISMFGNAVNFNQPLNNWNTAKVTNMGSMFDTAYDFNQDISNWNTANVTSMYSMFVNCINFNQPLANWNTAKVTNMSYMFINCYSFNQLIGNWDTSKVTDMEGMFRDARAFNQDISIWDTSKVIDMKYMFNDARAFNQDLSFWNVKTITTQPSSFSSSALAWTLPKPIWGTIGRAKVSMTSNYSASSSLSKLTGGNAVLTSNYSSTATAIDPVITFQLSSTNVSFIISGTNIKINYNNAAVSYATATNTLVQRTGISGIVSIEGNLTKFVANTGTITRVLNWKQPLQILSMKNQSQLTQVPTMLPTTVTSLFEGFRDCTTFNQDISTWNTANVTNMGYMFYGATNYNQPLNSLNTSNVTNMTYMFYGASAFNQPLANWNTAKVTNMSAMFYNASAFNQNLSSWDVVLIPSKPSSFDTGATAWTLPKPIWGTLGV